MSVFGSIVSAIFGSKHAASVTAAAGSSSPPASSRTTSASAGMAAGATAAKPISKADVEAILAKLADEQDEDLDWKTSIVDLMKLLKLDSSLGARKQLAQELGYTGALDGSAAMNVWLQKQVMTKLAERAAKCRTASRHEIGKQAPTADSAPRLFLSARPRAGHPRDSKSAFTRVHSPA